MSAGKSAKAKPQATEGATYLASGWYEHYWNPLRKVLAT